MTSLSNMNEIAKFKSSPIVTADKQALSEMVNSYLKELAFNGGEPLNDLALCRKYIYLLEELEKGIKDYVIKELKKDMLAMEEELSAFKKNKEAGTKYVYNIVPKPNETYTDLEEKPRRAWHH